MVKDWPWIGHDRRWIVRLRLDWWIGNGLIMDVQIGEGFLLALQKWPCIDIVVTRDSSSENDGVLRVVGPHSTRSLSSMRDVRTDWL